MFVDTNPSAGSLPARLRHVRMPLQSTEASDGFEHAGGVRDFSSAKNPQESPIPTSPSLKVCRRLTL